MTQTKYSNTRNTQKATDIFGANFKSSQKYASKVIEDFITNRIVQKDGVVRPEKFPLVQKAHLWGYVFYIWFHNQDAVKQVKTEISFRKDMADMIAIFLKRIVHNDNISKYLNAKKEVVYVTKSHLVMFVHHFISSIPYVRIPFLKRFSESTTLMDRLIAEVSKYFTLKIGDVLFTGTPAGVGPVKQNDLRC